MMKKLLFCICLSPLLLTAQINESDTLKVKASLSLTGFYQEGNVQTFIFRGRQDFSYHLLDKWVFKTTNSYVYQAFGGQKADEDILSLNFLYFNSEKKIYPLVLGFFSTNFRREIDRRILVGAGATYQVVNTEHHWLKLSVTGEYEETDFKNIDFNYDKYDGDESINTFRGTIWVNGKYHVLENKIILNHESYFQPSIQHSKNYRWQADLGLEFPLTSFFSFKVNYKHTFESVVIANQKEEDQFLTFGFTIKSF